MVEAGRIINKILWSDLSVWIYPPFETMLVNQILEINTENEFVILIIF